MPKPASPTAKRKNGSQKKWNPVYHEYICIVVGGKEVCASQNPPKGKRFGPGIDNFGRDKYYPHLCDKVRGDDKCFEDCLKKDHFDAPRPYFFFLGPKTNCQEWTDNALKDCRSKCDFWAPRFDPIIPF
jgi:hypothetical protein